MASRRKTCQAPHCDRPARTKGYCPKHYQQVHRYGRLTPEREHGRYPTVCIVEDCSRKSVGKGYCYRHYQQVRRHGRLIPEREYSGYRRVGCPVEGCEEKKHYARGYCKRHYSQWQRAHRKGKV